MPRTTDATAATVYALNTAGQTCGRCIGCGSWSPLWGATIIKVGKLVRMFNPRFGERMANGAIDERKMLIFPKMKTGHGCPVCADRYNAVCMARTAGKEPYLEVKDL
jgi:hypothetical protein